GHFDVPDMLEVLPEAYELVEDGHITAEDFRDFTFANAVRMWGAGNPGFFNGTVVEKAATAVLAETSGPAGPAAARGGEREGGERHDGRPRAGRMRRA